jgi:hypothetical protein
METETETEDTLVGTNMSAASPSVLTFEIEALEAVRSRTWKRKRKDTGNPVRQGRRLQKLPPLA